MTKFKGKYRVESTRLQGWDYASPGWYFVTICTKGRELFFGDVVDGGMQLSPLGEIAHQFWAEIPAHNPNAETDEFVIMPNHVHGIVVIKHRITPADADVETLHCNVSTDTTMSAISPKAGSLSAIIRSYKSAVTRWARRNGFSDFVWQSRFYDQIIRVWLK